jgi:hypothetical protein
VDSSFFEIPSLINRAVQTIALISWTEIWYGNGTKPRGLYSREAISQRLAAAKMYKKKERTEDRQVW